MEREDLERFLAKEADGELAPEDAEALESEIASDPDAARLAASWREAAEALEGFTSDLGAPSEEARERVLTAADVSRAAPVRPRDRRFVLAAAAGLLLALGAGFGIGAAVFARPGSPGAPQTAAVDIRTLREALRETRALMPEQVRWTALCGGRLSLGTSPIPLRDAGAFHFATFFVERSDRPRPMICQIAVLDGEEAVVEWESDGQGSIGCTPVAEGRAEDPRIRLWTRVSFRPEGSEQGVMLAGSPTISGGERVPLVSSRVGGVAFSVSVVVERASSGREGTTL